MKRKNKRIRMSAFLATMILMILSFCGLAFAGESTGIDLNQPITLTIDLEEQDRCAAISLYKVGEWDGRIGAYALTAEFSGSGAEIRDLTTSAMLHASKVLETYAKENGNQAFASQTTHNGIAQFSDLPNGLYLICQEKGTSDNVIIQPFLTTLPVMDEEKHVWNYDVKAYPKNEPDNPTPTEPDDPTPTEPDKPTPTEPNKPTPDKPDRPDKPDEPGGFTPTEPSPGQPVPRDGGNPPSLTELADSVIPLSGLERMLEQIEDMMTPLAVLPRTGDGSVSYGLLSVIVAVSGILIFSLIRKRKKQKEQAGN